MGARVVVATGAAICVGGGALRQVPERVGCKARQPRALGDLVNDFCPAPQADRDPVVPSRGAEEEPTVDASEEPAALAKVADQELPGRGAEGDVSRPRAPGRLCAQVNPGVGGLEVVDLEPAPALPQLPRAYGHVRQSETT